MCWCLRRQEGAGTSASKGAAPGVLPIAACGTSACMPKVKASSGAMHTSTAPCKPTSAPAGIEGRSSPSMLRQDSQLTTAGLSNGASGNPMSKQTQALAGAYPASGSVPPALSRSPRTSASQLPGISEGMPDSSQLHNHGPGMGHFLMNHSACINLPQMDEPQALGSAMGLATSTPQAAMGPQHSSSDSLGTHLLAHHNTSVSLALWASSQSGPVGRSGVVSGASITSGAPGLSSLGAQSPTAPTSATGEGQSPGLYMSQLPSRTRAMPRGAPSTGPSPQWQEQGLAGGYLAGGEGIASFMFKGVGTPPRAPSPHTQRLVADISGSSGSGGLYTTARSSLTKNMAVPLGAGDLAALLAAKATRAGERSRPASSSGPERSPSMRGGLQGALAVGATSTAARPASRESHSPQVHDATRMLEAFTSAEQARVEAQWTRDQKQDHSANGQHVGVLQMLPLAAMSSTAQGQVTRLPGSGNSEGGTRGMSNPLDGPPTFALGVADAAAHRASSPLGSPSDAVVPGIPEGSGSGAASHPPQPPAIPDPASFDLDPNKGVESARPAQQGAPTLPSATHPDTTFLDLTPRLASSGGRLAAWLAGPIIAPAGGGGSTPSFPTYASAHVVDIDMGHVIGISGPPGSSPWPGLLVPPPRGRGMPNADPLLPAPSSGLIPGEPVGSGRSSQRVGRLTESLHGGLGQPLSSGVRTPSWTASGYTGLSGVSRHVADADAGSSRSSTTDPILMVLREYGAELPSAGGHRMLPARNAPGAEHLRAMQQARATWAVGGGRRLNAPGGAGASQAGDEDGEEEEDTGIVILAGGSSSARRKGSSTLGASRSGLCRTPQPLTARELHEQLLARYERRAARSSSHQVTDVGTHPVPVPPHVALGAVGLGAAAAAATITPSSSGGSGIQALRW